MEPGTISILSFITGSFVTLLTTFWNKKSDAKINRKQIEHQVSSKRIDLKSQVFTEYINDMRDFQYTLSLIKITKAQGGPKVESEQNLMNLEKNLLRLRHSPIVLFLESSNNTQSFEEYIASLRVFLKMAQGEIGGEKEQTPAHKAMVSELVNYITNEIGQKAFDNMDVNELEKFIQTDPDTRGKIHAEIYKYIDNTIAEIDVTASRMQASMRDSLYRDLSDGAHSIK